MKHWYCIYTKSRHEQHVSDRLTDLHDIEVLNPRIKTKKYVRGKMKEVTEELFPCYIFLKFDPLHYIHIIKYTRGVRRIVGDGTGNPFVVDEGIIEQIQSRIRNGFAHLENQFNAGDQIAIHGGPLKGFTGIFCQELNAQDRVLILLNTLAYQARVELDKNIIGET